MSLTKTNNLQQQSLQKLMNSIAFTEADLVLNDDGYFSDAQKKRLKPKIDLYIALGIIGSFVSFCFTSIFFFIGQNSAEYKFVTIISLIIFGICFYGISWGLGRKNQLQKDYGIKKVEGRAELIINYTGKNDDIPAYSMKINGVTFHLDENIYNSFDSIDYRIFYFRILKNELLSVEPIN